MEDLNLISFGQALEAIKNGLLVKRREWNDSWIRYYNPHLDNEFILKENYPCNGTHYPFLAMITTDRCFTPYTPTQRDMLAMDWVVLDILTK